MPGKIYAATLSRKSVQLFLQTGQRPGNLYFQTRKKSETENVCQCRDQVWERRTVIYGPASVVATTLEKKFIIRLTDGVAEYVDVKTGFNQNDKLEIFGKIKDGDILVNGATDEIKPGTKLIGKALKR